MSTTAPGGGAGGGPDKRRSLGKYVKRMSSVFKRDKPSKAPATSTPTTTAPTPTATAAAASTSAPTADPKPTATPTQSPAPAAAPEEPVTQTLNRSALQQERARALFAKYGLTLESHEWIAAPAQSTNVQRVEKPIRMRVHRSCHHCGMTFGADKICAGCEHKRCKKCPRYPKKRTPAEKGKETEGATKPKKKRVLTVTSKTGNELVYQHAKQRVRRTCHKCETMFIPPTSTICENCRHVRCTKCPREPAKTHKWPHGYPGDVDYEDDSDIEKELARVRRTWRKPRIRVRWECEGCNSLFHEGSAQCPGCGHERCEKCKRTPLKKVKKEPDFDPDLVRAVEEKLKALDVQEDPPAPGAGGT